VEFGILGAPVKAAEPKQKKKKERKESIAFYIYFGKTKVGKKGRKKSPARTNRNNTRGKG
jgi:hypothetical protein